MTLIDEGLDMVWFIMVLMALGAVIVYFLFDPVNVKRHRFWKFAENHPEAAYYFFKGEDCFMVFDYNPQNGCRPDLSSGEWDGPFKLRIPSRGCTLTIYGRSPHYKYAIENLMERFHQ